MFKLDIIIGKLDTALTPIGEKSSRDQLDNLRQSDMATIWHTPSVTQLGRPQTNTQLKDMEPRIEPNVELQCLFFHLLGTRTNSTHGSPKRNAHQCYGNE